MAANPALWADVVIDLDAALDHARRAGAMRAALLAGRDSASLETEAYGLALGKHLEDAYTALERAFERLVVVIDGDRPGGADYHRQLLSRAAHAVPGMREAILPDTLVGPLSLLLAFRHAFRNSYAGYDAARALANVDIALATAPAAAAAIERFCRDFGVAPPGLPPRFPAA